MAVTPIHPGERLAEELQALGMSAVELARKLGVPTNRGLRRLTAVSRLPSPFSSTFNVQPSTLFFLLAFASKLAIVGFLHERHG